jgi:hypothetical protein
MQSSLRNSAFLQCDLTAVDWAPAALIAAGVIGLGIISTIILGGDLSAAFPRGDGGLFYSISRQIIAAHFLHPARVPYNGTLVPFSYSPAAFYAVAALSVLLHQTVPHSMNLWVMLWDFLIAPAAYVASKQFLKNRIAAFVATAFLVVIPFNSAYLGMGGGVTRAPGFVLYILGCGAAWRALRQDNARALWAAALLGAAIAWIHMEFFFLYAISACVFAVWLRCPVSRAMRLGGLVGLFSLPWLLLVPDLHSLLNAMGTAHFESRTLPADVLLSYFGFDVFKAGLLTSFVPLMIFLSSGIALVKGRPLWAVWALIILVADSRAGAQGAHLPSALAIGWCFGAVRERLRPGHPLALPAVGLVLSVLIFAGFSVYYGALSFPRLNHANVADATWLQHGAARNADVLVLSPGSFRDMTYEWFSALQDRRDPLTYEGLEWVDSRTFSERIRSFWAFNEDCRNGDGSCIVYYVGKLQDGFPTYIYVPRNGDIRRYETILTHLAHDRRFTRINSMRGGALFLLANVR